MLKSVSQAEIEYIIEGCVSNIRSDGRSQIDIRAISIENDIFPHVNGSSRVRVGNSIDIICTVKIEVTNPLYNIPDKGIVEVNVEYSPCCNHKLDDRKMQESCYMVSEYLQGIYYGSNAIDLKSLNILHGRFCWIVHIDLLILQDDGNLIDISSIASYCALHGTKLPGVELIEGESGEYEDFELLSGDLAEATVLQLHHVPLCISVSKIGSALILDCNGVEENCTSMSLVVSVDEVSLCCGVKKLRGGMCNTSEIDQAMTLAVAASLDIFPKLQHILHITNEEDRQYPDVPPTRLGLLA